VGIDKQKIAVGEFLLARVGIISKTAIQLDKSAFGEP
jgi:hypothetical protein